MPDLDMQNYATYPYSARSIAGVTFGIRIAGIDSIHSIHLHL